MTTETKSITREQAKRNRALWADALLGNLKRKYRQRHGSLASPTFQSFCCLGVACESVPELGVRRCEPDVDGGDYREMNTGTLVTGTLNAKQHDLLGITEHMEEYLIGLNDVRHVPLKVIGEVVRALPIVLANDKPWNAIDFINDNPRIAKFLSNYTKEYPTK